MALAVRAAQTGERPQAQVRLACSPRWSSARCSSGSRSIEYADEVRRTTSCPGPNFHFDGAVRASTAQLFFSLYFAMTGLHALT